MRICRKHRDMAPANNFKQGNVWHGGSHTFPCNLVVKIRLLRSTFFSLFVTTPRKNFAVLLSSARKIDLS